MENALGNLLVSYLINYRTLFDLLKLLHGLKDT